MRISDYIEQACGNLWKKKLRTFLTTSGVVIGVGALVSMFAFGQGVQKNITDQFKELELFNYVNVFAKDGGAHQEAPFDPDDPDSARGQRETSEGGSAEAEGPSDGRTRDAGDHAQTAPEDSPQETRTLDDRFLAEVTQIEGVEAAFPEMRFPAQIRLGEKEESTLVQVLSSQVCRSGLMQLRAGSAYESDEPNELIISDSILRRLDVRKPETAVGREIELRTLTLDLGLTSLLQMVPVLGGQTPGSSEAGALPFSQESYTFKIVGVAERMGFGGPLPVKSDVFIPPLPAERMKKLSLTSIWDFFQPAGPAAGYSMVTVRVSSPTRVRTVKKQLEDWGFRTFALIDQLEEMQKGFIIMDTFLLAVGMIGITVASLGIVNTMVMSILERYREIGIMKAVGATDGDVQKIFLFESAAIGFLGGVFGLTLGWVVSFVINEVVNGLTAGEGVPYIHYFSFPWWLCLGAIAFSIFVSLAAGIYPTLRAARVDPVVALRHD